LLRLWLSKNAAASLQEQLAAQLLLGIFSGKLAPGDRLPSVRQLARQHGIHANTVSLVYRDLRRRGWLHFQHGSAVYVRRSEPLWLKPDPEMFRIFGAELEEAYGFPVTGSPALFANLATQVRSMPEILSGLKRPPFPILIAIVTSSAQFRSWAATLLAALNIGKDAVLWRDPREPNWREGLASAAIIGADLIAARALTAFPQLHTIRLLRPESVTKLRPVLTLET
jgi:DNA-binding transcriptional regulator YhcF (GntR family)